jgi:hypothetical protein
MMVFQHVVPAYAGTHTPCPLVSVRRQRPSFTMSGRGYGSRRAPGRRVGGLTLAAFIALAAAPAWAEGSLGLDEVMVAVDKSPNLVAEIQAELGRNNLKAVDLSCVGARHGNQWTYLGGGRAAPYDCDIGKRSLHIEADRIYFDASGKSLGDLEKASPKRAKTFVESNFRWTWTP